MNQADLRDALNRLQLELLNADSFDAETQARVDTLLKNINDPEKLPETKEEYESLNELLKDTLTALEATNPTLTAMVNQVMSLLSSIGV